MQRGSELGDGLGEGQVLAEWLFARDFMDEVMNLHGCWWNHRHDSWRSGGWRGQDLGRSRHGSYPWLWTGQTRSKIIINARPYRQR